jgi:hypothetical protein
MHQVHTSVDKNPKMKDLTIVVLWVQALIHLILKGCGLQVIDRGKQGTRPIPGRNRYTKLLVGTGGKKDEKVRKEGIKQKLVSINKSVRKTEKDG